MVAAMPLVRMFDDEVVSFCEQPVAAARIAREMSPIFIACLPMADPHSNIWAAGLLPGNARGRLQAAGAERSRGCDPEATPGSVRRFARP
ncbi:MAG: hypothetical protein AMXMBFR56_32850 [Polyangiaceae bacterium]